MNFQTETIKQAKKPLSTNPKKFVLWLFMVSIIMLFAGLTSAYIVRRLEGNWLQFELPGIFWVNTVVLLLSSATIHWAYLSAKRNNLNDLKISLIFTTVLGMGFLYGQFAGWQDLVEIGVYLVGNPSGSFMYVFTGVHGFHLITGIIFLIVVLILSVQYKVHSKSMLSIEMCATYWHFLDGLWLYLFVFLLISR
ncbi:MAG: cytochrome oxidase subunit III [Cytophagales bacterium]|nr:cytochrome oxidase subunit III [Cytophagales bacterium]